MVKILGIHRIRSCQSFAKSEIRIRLGQQSRNPESSVLGHKLQARLRFCFPQPEKRLLLSAHTNMLPLSPMLAVKRMSRKCQERVEGLHPEIQSSPNPSGCPMDPIETLRNLCYEVDAEALSPPALTLMKPVMGLPYAINPAGLILRLQTLNRTTI